jgi:hypothetical protein
MDTTKVKRMIVCAAIHYQNGKFYDIQQPWNTKASGGLVVCGHNHSVCISLLALLFPNLEYKGKTVDGFVTSDHCFVDRKEALKIAQDAEQIFYKHSPKDKLLSEDLRPLPQVAE